MKKFLLVALLVAVLLTACGTPALLGLSNLPQEAIDLIMFLLTAGFTWVLLQLSKVLNIDLSGYVAAIVAIVAPILVTLIESWLQLIPPAFDNIVLTVIHLIVLALGSLGVYVIARRNTTRTLVG